MAKERNIPADYALYVATRLVVMLLHCVPIWANMGIARALGSLLYLVDKKHRQRGTSNLKRAFPEFSEAQCRHLTRQSMQHMVMLAIEMMFTTKLIRLNTWQKHVDLVNFGEVLELLVRQKTGMIMLTGHYGNWEILGYLLATLGFETTSIARPLDNEFINRWVLGVRERQGQRIVAKTGATEEIVPVLENRGAVGFIADQNAGHKGIFVDFFGRKASTYKSIGLLAMEYRVPVVVGYARRTRGPFHFEVGVQDLIRPEDWEAQDQPLKYITQRYTTALEQVVRVDPCQYLWLHRRWKTRPKGETPEAYD